MLTSWTISNFKSIREVVTLELAPLTVFSGSNSSGKSTLIQSILMVAQSFASVVDDEALVLNGRFLQLGRLQDVLHHNYDNQLLQVGFSWQPAAPLLTDDSLTIQLEAQVRRARRQQQQSRPADRYYPRLSRSTLSFDYARRVGPDRAPRSLLTVRETIKPQIPVDYHLPANLRRQIEDGVFDYFIPDSTQAHLVQDVRHEQVERVALTNLIPTQLLIRVDLEHRQLVDDTEWIIGQLNRRDSDPAAGRTGQLTLSPLLKELFKLVEIEYDTPRQEAGRSFKHAVLTAKTPLTRRGLLALLEQHRLDAWQRALFRQALAAALVQYQSREREPGRAKPLPTGQIGYEARLLPVMYMDPIDQISRVMREQIYFLGPLRDEPRVIYNPPPLSEQWSVGQKGEYTAAMLDDARDLAIHYPIPPGDTFQGRFATREGRLIDALTLWLRRMGLAEAIDTEEAPKVGYRLTINSPGLKLPLDLTSVGVGVSQVLPTLVQTLLAPVGSILIFEQPELHLHPKVQSVLGDFFLGMAQLGKQCLVETHSEHLINRLRRRIVESPGDETLRLLRLYFAEKEAAATRFREVKPNEYGTILNWPEGFFDQGESESLFILQAQQAKRRTAQANTAAKQLTPRGADAPTG